MIRVLKFGSESVWLVLAIVRFTQLEQKLALVILKSCTKLFECSEKRMTAHYGHGQTYKF